jgi:4-amino-4-deoxy-L-arabinose transferase-like glycosyltransferase
MNDGLALAAGTALPLLTRSDLGALGFGAQVAARWELLGLEAGALLRLGLDGVLLALVAALGARRLAGVADAPLRRLLATALVALATVVAAATLLGAAGRLSHGALAGVLRLLFAALFLPGLVRRGPREWGRELAAVAAYPVAGVARSLAASWRRRASGGGARVERWLLAGIAAVLALFALLAVATQPLNWDAQSYRLARVALWLQEGSLAHLATNDERLNYVGQNADLLMLWLVSYFRRAFPLVHLVQYAGGLLACLATVELGAQLGLTRRARLVAVAVLVGIPTAGLQFFTAQTDLFVAGALAAGLAFLLPALRAGRAGDWLLVGVGVGLALGAKGTVLYWGPGLLLLAAGWAAAERAPWRRVLPGAALAAVVAVALSAFNFAQNWRSYGNPFAAEQAIALAHVALPSPGPPAPATAESTAPAAAGRAPLGPRWTNGLAVLWQLLMPMSNPLVPASWLEPPFDALLDDLAESSRDYRQLRRSLAESGGWEAHGLSEDEASFGLIVPLLALVAGAGAAWRAVRRRAPDEARWAAMALAVALFLVVFCSTSRMTWHQYRYFCMLAPFTSLLAVAALTRARGLAGRAALAALAALAVGQLAVAIHLGMASEYHGWRALVDARGSQYDFLWSEPTALVRELGERPLRLGLVLPRDSWIAPFLRGEVAHRVRLLTSDELTAAGSLSELVARANLEAVVVAPELVTSIGSGLRALPAPRIDGRFRRIAFRPLRPGEAERPLIVGAAGLSGDGWVMPEASFAVASWDGPFELELRNTAPFARRVEIASAAGRQAIEIPLGASRWVVVPVRREDRVTVRIEPAFVPAEHEPPSADRRELGLMLDATAVVVDGIDADGWTRTVASLRIQNWFAGVVELEALNPAPFPRDVVLRSEVESVRSRLEAGARGRLAVAVRPRDFVELSVSPPFAAEGEGGRQLGVLLSPESQRQLSRSGR